LKTTDVELETIDGPARAFQATPAGTPSGAVIVIPEAFGVNEHIEDVTCRFAEAGFLSLGLDVFHRSGSQVAPYTDFTQVMALFEGLDDAGLMVDLDAALAHLATAGFPPSKVAVVGFCFGGRVAFLAALRRRLGAAISFYGGGIVTQGAFKAFPPLLDEVDQLSTPWLGLFGDLDNSIPIADVEALRETLSDVATPHEIVRYPDADHGFHCDARSMFNQQAAADAFGRSVKWLSHHLG
jgi:carboxymethylenebutenolidase